MSNKEKLMDKVKALIKDSERLGYRMGFIDGSSKKENALFIMYLTGFLCGSITVLVILWVVSIL